jgi:hypothetical protein
MQYRLVTTLIFLILFSISCTTAHIEHEVRQPDGQPFPDPYYVIQTVDPNNPIRVSFFYSSLEAVKDLDQTTVHRQKFLDRREDYFFSNEREDGIQLIVRVLNPWNVKYKVLCIQNIKFSDGGRMDSHSQIAYSDMKYREFSQKLPTWEGVKEVTYSLEISDNADNKLISTGKFHYYVSQ